MSEKSRLNRFFQFKERRSCLEGGEDGGERRSRKQENDKRGAGIAQQSKEGGRRQK